MGRMGLEGMLGATDRATALRWHLLHNHYPPYPAAMIAVAEAAIADPDGEVELPEGITHRRYGSRVPSRLIIDTMHLDEFLSQGEQ